MEWFSIRRFVTGAISWSDWNNALWHKHYVELFRGRIGIMHCYGSIQAWYSHDYMKHSKQAIDKSSVIQNEEARIAKNKMKNLLNEMMKKSRPTATLELQQFLVFGQVLID